MRHPPSTLDPSQGRPNPVVYVPCPHNPNPDQANGDEFEDLDDEMCEPEDLIGKPWTVRYYMKCSQSGNAKS